MSSIKKETNCFGSKSLLAWSGSFSHDEGVFSGPSPEDYANSAKFAKSRARPQNQLQDIAGFHKPHAFFNGAATLHAVTITLVQTLVTSDKNKVHNARIIAVQNSYLESENVELTFPVIRQVLS